MRIYASAAAEGLRPPGVEEGREIFLVEHPAAGDSLAAKVKGKRVPMTLEMGWKDGVCEIRRIVAEGWSE